jgi:AmmeMemoRadiSam system protein B
LRDPLRLSDQSVVIPQQWAPLLALCDGTRDAGGLSAALAVRFGVQMPPGMLGRLVAALDQALLLDNERSAQARAQALDVYRQAPCRPPVMAGRSYPTDAGALRALLDGYLAAVGEASAAATGCGLVSPHIDYARGGLVYARTWQRAAAVARAADLVVLLGTDHYGADGRLTLTRQHYSTPLGVLPTAQEVVDALAQALGEAEAFADELHHRSEHSIELSAVWLHHVRQDTPCAVVPILCGSFGHFVRGEAEPSQVPAMRALVETLQRTTAGQRVLVVASADLSHVGPAFGDAPLDLVGRARMKTADEKLIARICAGDAEGFLAAVRRDEDRYSVCGLPPIYAALRILGPVQGEVLAYDRCPADENGTSSVSVCGIFLKRET